ncbi:MAG: hypothetical protein NC123_03500 [Butyrivibrio sp.]|nr:hypothetical protein [Acetatifactor muris]MCM1558602.1 hypothetical protein [Butyrivibrio sp.]
MKRIITRTAAVLGFIIIAAVCLHKVYDVLRWKDTTGGYLSSIDQLYNTDEGLIDLVFVGSSHCYSGIHPELLWEERGIAGFDLAVSAQDRTSAYYQLKELLKTQHPEVVVADIYGICYEKHMVESNVYRNYLSMKVSLNSMEHIMTYPEQETREELLARWPVVHTRYRELKEFDFLSYEPNRIGRGSLLTWNVYAVEEGSGVNRCETVEPLSEQNREWVENMIALSEEEDFELIFMLIPWPRGDDKQAIINGFREYISEKEVTFLDLTELAETDICAATDWADPEHLNARGAAKLTEYLGDYITARYELPDRRNDGRYYQWDKALERYHQIEMLDQLAHITDLGEYISLLTEIPEITCILSLEGAYMDSGDRIYDCVAAFDMYYEDYMQGGKWLYRNGELTRLCENAPESACITDLSETDTLKVCWQGDFTDNNILIDGAAYGNTGSGLQIILYDNIENKVILTKEIQ